VGPRDGLDAVARKQNSAPAGNPHSFDGPSNIWRGVQILKFIL